MLNFQCFERARVTKTQVLFSVLASSCFVLIAGCSPSTSHLIIRDSARVQIKDDRHQTRAELEVGFTKRGLSAFWIPRVAAAANDSLESCPELRQYLQTPHHVASARITVRNRDVSVSALNEAPLSVKTCLESVFRNKIVGVDQAQFEVALNIRQNLSQ